MASISTPITCTAKGTHNTTNTLNANNYVEVWKIIKYDIYYSGNLHHRYWWYAYRFWNHAMLYNLFEQKICYTSKKAITKNITWGSECFIRMFCGYISIDAKASNVGASHGRHHLVVLFVVICLWRSQYITVICL